MYPNYNQSMPTYKRLEIFPNLHYFFFQSNTLRNTMHWVSLQPTRNTPSKRSFATVITYGRYIYLFGGCSSIRKSDFYLNDVHRFDEKNLEWERIHTKGTLPRPRYGHCAVCYESYMFIHGGDTKVGPSNETIRLDLKTYEWKQIDTKGYVPCETICATSVIYRDKMYVFGGTDFYVPCNQMRVLNLKTFEWNRICTVNPPSERYSHSAVVYKDTMFVFAGCGKNGKEIQDSDFYCFDFINNLWWCIPIRGEIPRNRCGHTAVCNGHQMVVFGGCDHSGLYASDCYTVDLRTLKWKSFASIGSPPGPCRYHCAVIVESRMYIFFGLGKEDSLNTGAFVELYSEMRRKLFPMLKQRFFVDIEIDFHMRERKRKAESFLLNGIHSPMKAIKLDNS